MISFITQFWTLFNWIFLIFLSFLLYISFVFIYDPFTHDLTSVASMAFGGQYIYTTQILIIGLIIMVHIFVKLLNVHYKNDQVFYLRRMI